MVQVSEGERRDAQPLVDGGRLRGHRHFDEDNVRVRCCHPMEEGRDSLASLRKPEFEPMSAM
jgi:hypothetical protein